jgi:hypothetical protein
VSVFEVDERVVRVALLHEIRAKVKEGGGLHVIGIQNRHARVKPVASIT